MNNRTNNRFRKFENVRTQGTNQWAVRFQISLDGEEMSKLLAMALDLDPETAFEEVPFD